MIYVFEYNYTIYIGMLYYPLNVHLYSIKWLRITSNYDKIYKFLIEFVLLLILTANMLLAQWHPLDVCMTWWTQYSFVFIGLCWYVSWFQMHSDSCKWGVFEFFLLKNKCAAEAYVYSMDTYWGVFYFA